LIESLEGKRGNPRIKPPFPAISGLWANPTVVNNVETIAAVPWIVNNSGAEYAKIGIGRSRNQINFIQDISKQVFMKLNWV
jgi:NADH-quinone oxidoreductase subunit F